MKTLLPVPGTLGRWIRRAGLFALFTAGVAFAASAILASRQADVAAAAPGLPAAIAHKPADAGPPNVVMLIMDDLDDSVWQNALDRGLLPRIQADVIDHGTTFDNMFVVDSLCCPSRTTYLTGQYPHNHGILDDFGSHGGFENFNNDGSTLATWMHAAGYRTGLIGKYLNGYGRSAKDDNGQYIPPGWDYWRALTSHMQFDYDMSVQGTMTHFGHADTDYQEDVLSGMAVDFLNVDDPRPVFLTLTPTAPHYEGSEKNDDDGIWVRPAPRYADTPRLDTIPPEALPSFNEADMSDKPKFMRSLPPVDVNGQRDGYNSKVAAIRAVDDLLGAVIDTLASSGRLANTLFIVTSDNGFQYGTHRRLGKTDLYEESIRVPMVIRAPAQSVPRHVDAWVANIDWAPTIAEFGGAHPDITIDGASLAAWARGGTGPQRKAMLVEQLSDYFFSIHPLQREVRSRDPAVTGDPTGDTTLIYAQTLTKSGTHVTDVEFYDLSIDPYELQSLHASTDKKRVKEMKQLKAQLLDLHTCAGAACLVQ
jgi:arylsulfatase A-like enzyme